MSGWYSHFVFFCCVIIVVLQCFLYVILLIAMCIFPRQQLAPGLRALAEDMWESVPWALQHLQLHFVK